MPIFPPDALTGIAQDVFVAAGVEQEEAGIVAEHLVASNLVGHDSHGVLRVPEYVEWMEAGGVVLGQHIAIMHETETLAVIEGGWGFGQVIGLEAIEVAMRKAQQTGVGIVAVSRCGHIGRVGHYPYHAAQQGLVTVLFVNTHGGGKLAAPWGGRGRRLSANPISVGIPRRADEPLVLDMATSSIAEGKLMDMLNRGVAAPPGCIVDAEGHPTTDPVAYFGPPAGRGCCLLAGTKALASPLSSTFWPARSRAPVAAGDDATRIGNGFLAFVIQPDQLRDADAFYADVDGLVQHVKSSELAAGFDEILAPGEPEIRTRRQRTREGIPVDDGAWGKICAHGPALRRYPGRIRLERQRRRNRLRRQSCCARPTLTSAESLPVLGC